MRSRREIWFRLRQEAANLAMFASPPKLPRIEGRTAALLPDPVQVAARLRGSAYALEVETLARSVMEHRFPLLGLTVETGPHIDWRRDYVHGISSGTPYFRRSPYLDFARVGDHKVVWELNRHQHLVILAQTFLFTGQREFLDESFRQLESWMDANPFLRGLNWASALEVAFRALSWTWLWAMAGDEMSQSLKRRFLTELFRHGCFLEQNLSVYFSPNTHLLGEAVALHALGALFPSWPRSARWVRMGGGTVLEQIDRQVRPDGSHFEQSSWYHVYALDFFLLHRALEQTPDSYDRSLPRMAEYLWALMGPSGLLPYFGDDDGGRLFHPYGDRSRFGRGTLASCAMLFGRPEWLWGAEDLACQSAWWFNSSALGHFPSLPDACGAGDSPAHLPKRDFPALSTGQANRLPHRTNTHFPALFPDAGVAIMTSSDRHIIIKAGPFGEGSGGHSHSDVLSLVVRIAGHEVLIDPGTYTYVADPDQRDLFRGSSAHNTVRIDGLDQAVPAGPFRWNRKPDVSIRHWAHWAKDSLDASCSYAGFLHRRQVLLVKPDLLVVLDTISGPPGEHSLEQVWHLGSTGDAVRLNFPAPAETLNGWRSRALGSKEPITVLRVTYRGPLPARMPAVLDLSEKPVSGVLGISSEGPKTFISWRGRCICEIR